MKHLVLVGCALFSFSAFSSDDALIDFIAQFEDAYMQTPAPSPAPQADVAPTSEQVSECVDRSGRDILNEPETFTKLIAEAESCSEAASLARACHYGSSLDVYTTGAAYQVCESELEAKGGNSPSALKAIDSMNFACAEKYAHESGSLYRSAEAHCSLSALEWAVDHLTAE